MSLACQQIEIYTKMGQLVLDPFVGVGTTVDAALKLGRRAIGVDINDDFIQIAKADIPSDSEDVRLITDDAHNLSNHLGAETVDFILTSPPYSNLLNNVKGKFAYKWREHSKLDPIGNPHPYSSDDRDLGNMPYSEFLHGLRGILDQCHIVLRGGAYCVWIVKDFRDLKGGRPYVNLHGDVISLAEQAKFTLWDVRIYDQTKFRPLVCLGYPSSSFYVNIGHSYMLVFRKQQP
jgi:DNA modification methylase